MLCKVHNLLNLCLRTEHVANGELLRASRTWVSTSEIYAKHLGALVLHDDALQKKNVARRPSFCFSLILEVHECGTEWQ